MYDVAMASMWTGAAVGLGLLAWGLRGRVVDRRPYCRGCRFELTGLSPEGACPECGRSLAGERAVRIGRRQRRWRVVAAGAALCLPMAAWWSVIGAAAAQGTDYRRWVPAGWLVTRVADSDEATAAGADWAEHYRFDIEIRADEVPAGALPSALRAWARSSFLPGREARLGRDLKGPYIEGYFQLLDGFRALRDAERTRPTAFELDVLCEQAGRAWRLASVRAEFIDDEWRMEVTNSAQASGALSTPGDPHTPGVYFAGYAPDGRLRPVTFVLRFTRVVAEDEVFDRPRFEMRFHNVPMR